MDRELSMSAEIAIGITILAAFLSIFMYVVTTSFIMRDKGLDTLVAVEDNVSLSLIQDIQKGRISADMPAATAYQILNKHRHVIVAESSGYDATIRYLATEDSILKTHLKGRVELKLRATEDDFYVAYIRLLDSNGRYIPSQNTQGFDLMDHTFIFK